MESLKSIKNKIDKAAELSALINSLDKELKGLKTDIKAYCVDHDKTVIETDNAILKFQEKTFNSIDTIELFEKTDIQTFVQCVKVDLTQSKKVLSLEVFDSVNHPFTDSFACMKFTSK